MQRSGPGSCTKCPLASMTPDVGGSNPAIIDNSALLPHPLGPRTTPTPPGATSRSMVSTATSALAVPSPHTLPTPRQRTAPLRVVVSLAFIGLLPFPRAATPAH